MSVKFKTFYSMREGQCGHITDSQIVVNDTEDLDPIRFDRGSVIQQRHQHGLHRFSARLHEFAAYDTLTSVLRVAGCENGQSSIRVGGVFSGDCRQTM